MPDPDRRLRERRFSALTAVLVAGAAGAMALAVAGGHVDAAEPRLWMLAALAVGLELMPIRVPRGAGAEVVTFSSAFALVVLLEFGVLAAMVVWVAATLTADASRGLGAPKALFNAAQYALSIGAAAVVPAVTGAGLPLALGAGALAPALATGLVLLTLNHAFAGLGFRVLEGVPLRAALLGDAAPHAMAALGQLVLALALLGAAGPVVALAGVVAAAGSLAGRRAIRAPRERRPHPAVTGAPS